MSKTSCKKCRRIGQKLFLKGERCFTPKCAMIKKPYAPGIHRKKRRVLSEYGAQLIEKQKVCHIYNLRERQFRRYISEAARKKGVIEENLVKKIELRLDNIVFRLGLADSRRRARQLVSHGHVLVNDRKINLPSFQTKPGDIIKIKKLSQDSVSFKDLKTKLKKYKPFDWLSLDKNNLEGKIISLPTQENVNIPADLKMIVEYYSR